MSLMTCCTHCHTVFRITPEDLQAQGGQVRCGRCLRVFNGLVALVPSPQTGAGPTVPPADIPPPVEASPVTAAVIGESDLSPTAAPWLAQSALVADGTAIVHADAPDLDLAPEIAMTEDRADDVPAPHAMAPEANSPEPVVDPDNPFVRGSAEMARPATRSPWLSAACALMLVALAAQVIYFYRGDIAARQPLVRLWLTEACAKVGCTVQLPQRPKAIAIEASDLQILDPARPNRIQLTATLRNHAGHDVAFPALDLVLTNANEHTLARRIFLPSEYLNGGRDTRAIFAANAELTVRLALETSDLGAAGFRLAVLAAPLQ